MLQRHSDIKVTGAAGINHIGKVYCGNFDCKTESKADEWNKTPRYSQFLLCYCSVSKKLDMRISQIEDESAIFKISFLIFVRGVIWHQEGYYCNII